MAESIQSTFGFYHTQILIPAESGDGFILVAGVGDAVAATTRGRLSGSLNDPTIAQVVSTEKAKLCDDLEPNWNAIPELPDAKSQLAVPLISSGNLLALIDIYSDQSLDFLSGELKALDGVMGQIAVAAELFELKRQLELVRDDNRKLYRRLTRAG